MNKTINHYANANPIVSVGITNENPEITGSTTSEFSFEIPSMGEDMPNMKVSFRTTSTVASSLVAQEKLNAMARENVDFIGSKIAEGLSYVMEHLTEWAEKIHEIDNLPKKWEAQENDGI